MAQTGEGTAAAAQASALMSETVAVNALWSVAAGDAASGKSAKVRKLADAGALSAPVRRRDWWNKKDGPAGGSYDNAFEDFIPG